MPERGEVWLVDFGITAKVRPALVISAPFTDAHRALIGVIPRTTAVRGSQFEVVVEARFLDKGAFLVQGIQRFLQNSFCAGLVFLLPHNYKVSRAVCSVGLGWRDKCTGLPLLLA